MAPTHYQDSEFGCREYDTAAIRAGRIPEHSMVLAPEVSDTLRSHTRAGSNSVGTLIAPQLARCIATREGTSQDWETTTMVAHSMNVAPCLTQNYGKQPDNSDTSKGPMLVAHALSASHGCTEDGTGRGTPIVPIFMHVNNGRPAGRQSKHTEMVTLETETVPTLATDGHQQSAIAFYQDQASNVRETGPAQTLSTRCGQIANQQTYVAFSAKDHGADASDIAPTLRAGGHTNSHANAGVMPAVAFCNTAGDTALGMSKPGVPPLTSRHGDPGNVLLGMQVRRLTPRECERLQGFPDDYTQVPYRGKPAADGPRYKALGNSMAVPVVRWLGERIQMVSELEAA